MENKNRASAPKDYESDYCHITYLPQEKAVLLTWKKFCCGEDYRKPVLHALKLLQEYDGSNFIADARNGFEDEKTDVEWAFAELIPEMAKTSCKTVTFIMNEVNEIEGEMDMWTKEFSKYFTVRRVASLEEAI